MKRMTDQTIIILYCFTSVLFYRINTIFIVAFLTAVISASLNHYLRSKKWNFFITAGYAAVSFLYPEFLAFVPVLIYGAVESGNIVMAALIGCLCLLSLIGGQFYLIVIMGIGIAFAVLLSTARNAYDKLAAKYKKTRDDSTELNLLLKEKNQNLLEKQDYEIYTATLRERNRIAREIHDNVGHMLSRSILVTGAMKAVNKDEILKEPLEQLEVTLNTAMDNVRESVHDLHDESVDLRDVLNSIVGDFTFCKASVDYDMGYEVPREIKYSFISIVKEALNNIVKHSNADKVYIIVREHPGMYQLIIEDNGTKRENTPENEKGIGLMNMRERVSLLKGAIQIQQIRGFRIFISVPKKENV